MAEIIFCPQCKRRLQIQAGFQAERVRCPSCEATFSFASVSPPPSTLVAALPPPSPSERPAPTVSRRPRSASVKRPARSTCLIVALVIGTVFLMMGAGITALIAIVWRTRLTSPANHAIRIEEDEEERRALLREAFKDRKPLGDDEIARQLEPLFHDLSAALRAGDSNRIMARIDADRMVDEFIAAGGALPGRTAKERREFRIGFRRGLKSIGDNLAQRGQIFHWDATEIRKIKQLNKDEAVVIARHKHPEGAYLKMRWWVTRRDGDWKLYDFEDLDMASRASSNMAAAAGQGLGRTGEIGRTVKGIAEAIQEVALDNIDSAEQKLNQVRGVQLPPRLESMRQLADGMILMHREKYPEAVKALQQAQRLQADLPIADFLLGVALNQIGKQDQALKHLKSYRDLFGEEAAICREIAEVLREQGRFAEAAKEYRKSLDFDPKDVKAFSGLLRSVADDKEKDIGPRFAKLDDLRANFEVCAKECEQREIPELLDPLVQIMRKRDPNYPEVDYYQALVQARTEHPDEAVRSLKSALRKQSKEDRRRQYEQHFLKAMAAGGHYRQAYAAATSEQEAFRFLAAEAAKRYDLQELRKLAAAYAQKHAEDPLLALYQAEILVREDQYDKADRAFTAALARRPDAETLLTFRASRVLARYHTGQTMSAYRAIGPCDETFLQLAGLLLQDNEDDQLQALIESHAKAAPDNIETIRFRGRLLIRRGKITEGISLFKSTLAKAKTEQKRSELGSELLRDLLAVDKPLEGYQAAPDAAGAFKELAYALIDEERWNDLRLLLEAHRAGHADDPWLAYFQGEVHQHDQAWDKMAKVLGEALKRDPKGARASLQTSYVFSLYKSGRWQRAYAEIEPHNETFTQLANLMANDKRGDELDALVRLHKSQAADDPDLLLIEARAKVLKKQYAESVPLFRRAYQKQTEDYRRRGCQSVYLRDLAAARRWLEGYRAAVDKNAALDTLGGELLSQKKDKELAALLEEHHKTEGEGPWHSFYLGELHLLRGDARKAARHFTAALAKGSKENQWRWRDGLVRARVRAGEAVAAYEENKESEGGFASLAQLCIEKKDAEQLQALLDAHYKDKSDDPALISWELELLWLRQEYERALRLLVEHGSNVFARPQFRWKADNYQVRCLVKLKRRDEAVRVAEILKKRSGNRLLLVLAYAASGDVPRTISAMGKQARGPYFVQNCYQDTDLGPILRGKGFEAFRDKFPEPKEDKQTIEP